MNLLNCRLLFSLGPLINKNVIYGTVVSGGLCTKDAGSPHGRSGTYANVRHPEIQEFIKSIVSDVEIEGQSGLSYFHFISNQKYNCFTAFAHL